MTAIDPFASARITNLQNPTRTPNDQFGKDTFLQLLVAQLRYQNPLDPQDGTEFITQTAQFTMVEKLTEIERQSLNHTATNEVLAASSMIGRRVNVALPSGDAVSPVATTSIDVGGNLPSNAPPGTRHKSTINIYTNAGATIPLELEFTRLDRQDANEWSVRARVGSQQVSGPHTISFDTSGSCTTSDLTISAAELDRIPGTAGKWDPDGLTLSLGSSSDPARLRSGPGEATAVARSQDGSNGQTLNGIVTSVRFDITGPILRVGDYDYEVPMGAVLEVQMPPT